jgi:carbamoyltransferase
MTALAVCLDAAGLPLNEIETIVFVGEGKRLPEEYSGPLPLLGARRGACCSMSHHLAHAYTAFCGSTFEHASVAVIDGEGNIGEHESFYVGSGRQIRQIMLSPAEAHFGIGRTYEAFTNLLGWHYQEAGTTMALAALGDPQRFGRNRLFVVGHNLTVRSELSDDVDLQRLTAHGLRLSPSGDRSPLDVKLAPAAAAHVLALEPNVDFGELEAGHPLRADLAAYVQRELEGVLIDIVTRLIRETGERRLCLAGGVALNVAANRALLEHTDVQDLFVAPAANDRGLPLGAALYGRHDILGMPNHVPLNDDFLGPPTSESEISSAITGLQHRLRALASTIHVDRPDDIDLAVAMALAEGKIIGRYTGRAELGPRALGNRSILADPRARSTVETLNTRIKRREPFRPYAASVLIEDAANCFALDVDSPFMLLLAMVRTDWRDRIPAVVHADGTCRLQTVDARRASGLRSILRHFKAMTGIPAILNTSFNEAGQPMVESPADALDCFLQTGLDGVALGPFLVTKVCMPIREPRRAPA